ncbi:MAG TPA: hypothetical protein VIU44_07560, partial [Gaiellaceae bacterium]
GPAGAATQIGAGAASLVTAGVGTSAAVAAALSIGAIGVLSGTFVLVFAASWKSGATLAARRYRAEA